MNQKAIQKKALLVFFGGFALMILSVLLYQTVGVGLITAMYQEQAPGWMNGLIGNRENPLEAYLILGARYMSRLLLLIGFAQLLAIAWIHWDKTKAIFSRYFNEPTHPLNLAIFRIVLFGTIYKFISVERFVELAKPGAEFIKLPQNLFWLEGHVPINASVIFVLTWILKIACFTSIIGLFTRISNWIVAVISLYVLCLPIMFGKLEHHHHLVLLSFIMAASRCGDYLSLDALIRRWRGRPMEIKPHRVYSLPIRFIWLGIGMSYFSAGFWKWCDGGWDWIFSENLKLLMHKQWMLAGGDVPLIRIDRSPFLYGGAAAFTIAWEMGFPFAMIFPRARILFAFLGLFFHVMILIYMNIFFWFIMTLYVVFFDWYAILKRLGFYKSEAAKPPDPAGTVASVPIPMRSGKLIWIIGLTIFFGQTIEGFRKHKECWPFACYPTFATVINTPYFKNTEFALVKQDGEEVPYDPKQLIRYFHNSFQVGQVKRRVALTENIDDLERQMKTLLELIKESRKDIQDYSAVRFYRLLLDTNPDRWEQNPVERDLIKEYPLSF